MKRIYFIAALLVILAALHLSKKVRPVLPQSVTAQTVQSPAETPAAQQVLSGGLSVSSSPTPLPRPQESSASKADALRSLDNRVATLSEAIKAGYDLKSLVGQLKKEHPILARTSNPYTGDLTIVRTEQPLVGTRYFHAQYMGKDGESYLQHMSFEFEPSATAMNDAVSAVEKSFGVSRAAAAQHGPFIQWELPDGYVVWVKKLSKTDLQNNPYNAYSKADAGGIQVTVEINQEDSEG